MTVIFSEMKKLFKKKKIVNELKTIVSSGLNVEDFKPEHLDFSDKELTIKTALTNAIKEVAYTMINESIYDLGNKDPNYTPRPEISIEERVKNLTIKITTDESTNKPLISLFDEKSELVIISFLYDATLDVHDMIEETNLWAEFLTSREKILVFDLVLEKLSQFKQIK